MTAMYEVTITLSLSGGPQRAEHFQEMADAYAALEEVHDELLDSSLGFHDSEDRALVDLELTVLASDEDEAYRLASSSVRAAIQKAGGFKPGWGERVPPNGWAVYPVAGDTVGLVDA